MSGSAASSRPVEDSRTWIPEPSVVDRPDSKRMRSPVYTRVRDWTCAGSEVASVETALEPPNRLVVRSHEAKRDCTRGRGSAVRYGFAPAVGGASDSRLRRGVYGPGEACRRCIHIAGSVDRPYFKRMPSNRQAAVRHRARAGAEG